MEKIRTSEKVVKKLEIIKQKQMGDDVNGDSDADMGGDDGDNQDSSMSEDENSDDSTMSTGEPTSLTESMQLVEMVLKDSSINNVAKIDKLESLLSFAEQFSKKSDFENG